MLNSMYPVNYYCTKIIAANHVFCGRQGGCSVGEFSSLNCSETIGDDPHSVATNRKRISARFFHHTALVTANQQHTNIVAYINNPDDFSKMPALPIADALVTQNPQIAIGVQTADCVPILLFEPTSNMVAAIHAGWRGAVSGIIENTLAAMIKHGADISQIAAGIGPCIQQSSYEVGPDVIQAFTQKDQSFKDFFILKAQEKWLFSLSQCCELILKRQGVRLCHNLGIDTYARPEEFFSARYATHNKQVTGRQLSCIIGRVIN